LSDSPSLSPHTKRRCVMGQAFLAEVVGTMVLIILGDGVVANVVLNKSKGQNSGWIVITTGWGLAVTMARPRLHRRANAGGLHRRGGGLAGLQRPFRRHGRRGPQTGRVLHHPANSQRGVQLPHRGHCHLRVGRGRAVPWVGPRGTPSTRLATWDLVSLMPCCPSPASGTPIGGMRGFPWSRRLWGRFWRPSSSMDWDCGEASSG